jgi:uncharacterized membrane protein
LRLYSRKVLAIPIKENERQLVIENAANLWQQISKQPILFRGLSHWILLSNRTFLFCIKLLSKVDDGDILIHRNAIQNKHVLDYLFGLVIHRVICHTCKAIEHALY